ncbi:MAG: hypothetical protein ACPGC9_00365 [Cytophagales bacterium]
MNEQPFWATTKKFAAESSRYYHSGDFYEDFKIVSVGIVNLVLLKKFFRFFRRFKA